MFECNHDGTTDVCVSLKSLLLNSSVLETVLFLSWERKKVKTLVLDPLLCGLASGAAGGACEQVLLWFGRITPGGRTPVN